MRAAVAFMLMLLPATAQAERVKDIARFAGVRANALTGYGIVVGLTGSGDQNLEFTIQSLKSAANRLGVQLPPGVNPQLRNAAAVMVTAELPAFAKPGQRLDVTVSAPKAATAAASSPARPPAGGCRPAAWWNAPSPRPLPKRGQCIWI